MKPSFTLPAIFATLVFGSLSASAQRATQSRQSKPGPSGAYTLHVDAEEVVLNCTVLDKKGELVNV
jgi:hypothetical protein